MKPSVVFAITAMAWSAAMPLHAAGFGSADAESLIAKNQAALVEVHATITVKPELIEGPPGIAEMINQQPANDQPGTTKGVVIRGDGLVAVPLAALDPASLMGDGMEVDTPLGKLKIGMKSSVSAVKIITGDGHEYPAELVFKEAAAGLALLKVTSPPAEGMAAVALTKDLPAAKPFSRAFGLARLGAQFGSAPTIRTLRIGSITPPPTPLYDLAGTITEPGTVAFDPEGRFIGLAVMTSRSQSIGMAAMTIMILPLAEIQRLSAKVIP